MKNIIFLVFLAGCGVDTFIVMPELVENSCSHTVENYPAVTITSEQMEDPIIKQESDYGRVFISRWEVDGFELKITETVRVGNKVCSSRYIGDLDVL